MQRAVLHPAPHALHHPPGPSSTPALASTPPPAVKYADLKNHRTTNYKFSYDDMLSMNVSLLALLGMTAAC